MVENSLRWFGQIKRRHVNSIVKSVDQMEGNLITRGGDKPR